MKRVAYILFLSCLFGVTTATAQEMTREERIKALERLQAEDVVMLGDSWNSDIQGAINAGIDQIWIRRSKDPLPEGQTATYIVQSLAEVMEIL